LGAVALREIEVSRDAAGAPSLKLYGGAERARAALGWALHLSLSHDGGVALALVVGDAE
jgi:holo-[acyl-carrier protein] synthase